jgi:predicted enzyme related to lactoylglutathione lyase
MKKVSFSLFLLATSFAFGFAFKSMLVNQNKVNAETKRVTGIGGIFFKCKNPAATREWYKVHLGLNTDNYGTNFQWYQGADSTKKGSTQWSAFKETTKYFEPSSKDFMINYRVENMNTLMENLRKEGVTIVDTIQSFDYGKFLHIMDNDGNKIELWEPVDDVYDRFPGGKTK